MQLQKKINKRIKVVKLSKGNSNNYQAPYEANDDLPDYSFLYEMNKALHIIFKGLKECGHDPTCNETIDLIYPKLDGSRSKLIDLIKFHDDFTNEDTELNKAVNFWVNFIIKTQDK